MSANTSKQVIVVVEGGCAEVFEQPADLDVIIVDQDGDYPYLCRKCNECWGPDTWKEDETEVESYDPADDEAWLNRETEHEDWEADCPSCKHAQPATA